MHGPPCPSQPHCPDRDSLLLLILTGSLEALRTARRWSVQALLLETGVGKEAHESEGAGDTEVRGTQECSGAWAGVNPARLVAGSGFPDNHSVWR